MLFSREGQRAITRALQRGFEAVAGAAHACEDEAEAEALAGLAEGGVLAGLLDGGGDVLVERSCFNCCGTGHFSNDCPCDAPTASVGCMPLRSRSDAVGGSEPPWEEDEGGASSGSLCYWCGEAGHLARACPLARKKQRQQPNRGQRKTQERCFQCGPPFPSVEPQA